MSIELDGIPYPDVKLSCNRENMTILVEALESDSYPQVHGQLRLTGDVCEVIGYCCLGVACEKSGKGTWDGDDCYTTPGGRDFSFLPDTVGGWLGLESSLTDLQVSGPDVDGDVLMASNLNDAMDDEGNHMWPFPKIAARLREVYLTD